MTDKKKSRKNIIRKNNTRKIKVKKMCGGTGSSRNKSNSRTPRSRSRSRSRSTTGTSLRYSPPPQQKNPRYSPPRQTSPYKEPPPTNKELATDYKTTPDYAVKIREFFPHININMHNKLMEIIHTLRGFEYTFLINFNSGQHGGLSSLDRTNMFQRESATYLMNAVMNNITYKEMSNYLSDIHDDNRSGLFIATLVNKSTHNLNINNIKDTYIKYKWLSKQEISNQGGLIGCHVSPIKGISILIDLMKMYAIEDKDTLNCIDKFNTICTVTPGTSLVNANDAFLTNPNNLHGLMILYKLLYSLGNVCIQNIAGILTPNRTSFINILYIVNRILELEQNKQKEGQSTNDSQSKLLGNWANSTLDMSIEDKLVDSEAAYLISALGIIKTTILYIAVDMDSKLKTIPDYEYDYFKLDFDHTDLRKEYGTFKSSEYYERSIFEEFFVTLYKEYGNKIEVLKQFNTTIIAINNLFNLLGDITPGNPKFKNIIDKLVQYLKTINIIKSSLHFLPSHLNSKFNVITSKLNAIAKYQEYNKREKIRGYTTAPSRRINNVDISALTRRLETRMNITMLLQNEINKIIRELTRNEDSSMVSPTKAKEIMNTQLSELGLGHMKSKIEIVENYQDNKINIIVYILNEYLKNIIYNFEVKVVQNVKNVKNIELYNKGLSTVELAHDIERAYIKTANSIFLKGETPNISQIIDTFYKFIGNEIFNTVIYSDGNISIIETELAFLMTQMQIATDLRIFNFLQTYKFSNFHPSDPSDPSNPINHNLIAF